jgi:hypothetical protein
MSYRRPVVVLAHLVLWTLAFYGAFFLRFDGRIPDYYLRLIPYWLIPLLAAAGHRARQPRALPRALALHGHARPAHAHPGRGHLQRALRPLRDLHRPAVAAALGLRHRLAARPHGRRGMRLAIRATRETCAPTPSTPPRTRKKILVVGAGDAGEMLVREIHKTHAAQLRGGGLRRRQTPPSSASASTG